MDNEPPNGIQVGNVPNFADTAFLVQVSWELLIQLRRHLGAAKTPSHGFEAFDFSCVRKFGESGKLEQFVACN